MFELSQASLNTDIIWKLKLITVIPFHLGWKSENESVTSQRQPSGFSIWPLPNKGQKHWYGIHLLHLSMC